MDQSGIVNLINQALYSPGVSSSPFQNEPINPATGQQAPLAPTSNSNGGVLGDTTYNQQYAQQQYDAQQAAINTSLGQYDQSIGNTNSAINRLGSQQATGNTGIDSSYQNAINQLLLGKNQGQTAYDANKQQSATGYVGAKNTIGSQAGASLNGLLRLLGSRGAGGGSAYNMAAPQAVGREASLQRSGAGQTFGENNQALDTNWNNYMTGYNNQVSGVGNQRDQQKQTLQSSIDTNRASLLQSLATLQGQRAQVAGGSATGASQPYLDQANTLLDKVSNAPAAAPINYQTQAYQAPSVASYTVNPNATPTYNGQTGGDYFSPYLQSLLGKKQQTAA